MYAIIKTGGKQYKVSEGDVITVEKLAANEGDAVVFDNVLTVVNDGDVKVGTPVVEGAKVTGKVEAQGKAKKILVFKYKAKSNYRRRQGHRQPFTKVVIEKIDFVRSQGKLRALRQRVTLIRHRMATISSAQASRRLRRRLCWACKSICIAQSSMNKRVESSPCSCRVPPMN